MENPVKDYSLPESEFSRFLYRMDSSVNAKIVETGLQVLQALQNGNICIELSGELNTNEFLSSKLVGTPGSKTIFILEEQKLYFQKYWKYEQELAAFLKKKSRLVNAVSEETFEFIETQFKNSEETDWQKIAVKLSLLKELVIITGSPGTGKTYTIQKIIEAFCFEKGKKSQIYLATPTGKAAQRLNDSLTSKPSEGLAIEAQTIHSLLGARIHGDGFRFNENNPLKADMIIIDEASMLDISLWITLIRAVTEKTKLILMGDPHQLASVEAGSILGDICSQASNSFSQEMALKLEIENNDDSTPDFNDSIINLTKSYRFSENSGIKSISDAINEGDSEKVIELLESKEFPELVWVEPSGTTINQLIEKFSVVPYTKLFNDGFSSETLNEYQILTAYRKGPFGSEYINLRSEQRIKSANNIDIDTVWFDGRSVIATRNNHTLGIKNGEIGIYNASRGLIKFEGEQEEGISISRLTHYEPSQSITIHKSQGSEYRNVAIVLPMAENELLTKELLYTAVTRARESILVVGKRKTIIDTVRQSINRKSGLIKKIWE